MYVHTYVHTYGHMYTHRLLNQWHHWDYHSADEGYVGVWFLGKHAEEQSSGTVECSWQRPSGQTVLHHTELLLRMLLWNDFAVHWEFSQEPLPDWQLQRPSSVAKLCSTWAWFKHFRWRPSVGKPHKSVVVCHGISSKKSTPTAHWST